MPDSSLGIDRARRRDWTAEDDGDPAAVSAGAATGELRRMAREQAAGERTAQWLRESTSDTCTSFEHPLHRFDACVADPYPRPGGTVSRSRAPFLREHGNDVDVISPSDVKQGALGDCALMATLAGLASTKEGRALIHDAITEQRDERGDVVGYSVRLYGHEPPGSPTLVARRIEISAGEPYVVGHARAQGDLTRDEIWPLLVEQAYAKLRGGYDAFGHGDTAQAAIEALVGSGGRHSGLSEVSDELLWSDLAAGKVVVLSSCHFFPSNPYELSTRHAYAVTGRIDRGGGDVLYELRNPWKTDQPQLVRYADLARYFNYVDVGPVQVGP